MKKKLSSSLLALTMVFNAAPSMSSVTEVFADSAVDTAIAMDSNVDVVSEIYGNFASAFISGMGMAVEPAWADIGSITVASPGDVSVTYNGTKWTGDLIIAEMEDVVFTAFSISGGGTVAASLSNEPSEWFTLIGFDGATGVDDSATSVTVGFIDTISGADGTSIGFGATGATTSLINITVNPYTVGAFDFESLELPAATTKEGLDDWLDGKFVADGEYFDVDKDLFNWTTTDEIVAEGSITVTLELIGSSSNYDLSGSNITSSFTLNVAEVDDFTFEDGNIDNSVIVNAFSSAFAGVTSDYVSGIEISTEGAMPIATLSVSAANLELKVDLKDSDDSASKDVWDFLKAVEGGSVVIDVADSSDVWDASYSVAGTVDKPFAGYDSVDTLDFYGEYITFTGVTNDIITMDIKFATPGWEENTTFGVAMRDGVLERSYETYGGSVNLIDVTLRNDEDYGIATVSGSPTPASSGSNGSTSGDSSSSNNWSSSTGSIGSQYYAQGSVRVNGSFVSQLQNVIIGEMINLNSITTIDGRAVEGWYYDASYSNEISNPRAFVISDEVVNNGIYAKLVGTTTTTPDTNTNTDSNASTGNNDWTSGNTSTNVPSTIAKLLGKLF